MMTMREVLETKGKQRRLEKVVIHGDEFWLRQLSGLEKANYELLSIDKKNGTVDYAKLPQAKLHLVCWSLVDHESGERLYQDEEWTHLAEVSTEYIEPLYAACLRLNHYEQEVVEEMVGNSE